MQDGSALRGFLLGEIVMFDGLSGRSWEGDEALCHPREDGVRAGKVLVGNGYYIGGANDPVELYLRWGYSGC